MSDKSVDDLLTDLKTALDVTPSAGFAAGVRARVAPERAPRGLGRWWPLAAAAAIAASAVVVVVMRSHPTPDRAVDRPATVAAAAPVEVPRPVVSAPTAPVAPTGARAAVPVAPRVARASASEPTLEVITNQGEILRAMWRRAGVGALREVETEQATATTAGSVTAPTQAIVVMPVTIDPIVISTLGGSSSSGATTPNGSTIRRAYEGRN